MSRHHPRSLKIFGPYGALFLQRSLGMGLVLGLAVVLTACGEDADDDRPGAADGDETEQTDGAEGSGGEQPPGAPAAALADATISLSEIGQFDAPTAIVGRPDDTALFVSERGGQVIRVAVEGTGADRTYRPDDQPLLDINELVVVEGERGLLDLEFSPDGARLYVSYSLDPDGESRVESYAYDGTAVDPGSRREVLTVGDFAPNHNGGDLEFGPDGFLYVAMGDGGGAGDPEGNGQDTGSLLGKLLRLDPEGAPAGEAYAVPPDNPFVGGGGAPEVWLYGVRNPWRFSFDRDTSDLWIGDVGQNEWEEIDVLAASEGGGRGENLGWNEVEGTHPFEGGSPPDGAVTPVYEYANGEDGACSVTGGFVYRGQAIPALRGAYVFGDYCATPLRAIQVNGSEVTAERTFDGVDVEELVSFGEDNDGELYAVSLTGPIYRLDP
jgi:glucose/arabinose dehydrogenase